MLLDIILGESGISSSAGIASHRTTDHGQPNQRTMATDIFVFSGNGEGDNVPKAW